jgi:hypothetical protein
MSDNNKDAAPIELLDRYLPKKRVPKCPNCKLNGIMDDRYDSYYCPEDNLWLQPECGCKPGECGFSGRPPFPREAVQKTLPQFKDLEHINLSGDLDPTEYIRKLRDE